MPKEKQRPFDGYRTLFENNPHPMWVYDLESLAFLEVNDAALSRYGYTRAEFLAMTLKDICLPEDLPRLFTDKTWKETAAQPSEEWRHRIKDGRVIDVSTASRPLEFHGRKAVLTVVQDITKPAQTEDSLQESGEQFRKIIDALPAALMLVDAAGRIVMVNPAGGELFGYEPGELTGQPIDHLLPERYRSRHTNLVAQYFSTPQPRTMGSRRDLTGRHKNGSEFPVEIGLTHLRQGDETLVVALIVDIIGRKQVEEALKEAKNRYRTLFEQSANAIFILDLEGRHVEANLRAAEILGYTREEIQVLSMREISAQVDQSTVVLERLRNGETIPPYERLFKKKDGELVWVELHVTAIRDEQGRPIRVQSIAQDITERKQANEALQASEDRYRQTLDNMLEGCQIIGFDWRYLYVNDAVAKQGHQAKDDLLGNTMMEVYPGIENTAMFSVLRRCMDERVPDQMVNEFTYPDGTSGWFELSIQPVPEGLFILSNDITERKQAEEDLRKSEQKFSILFEKAAYAATLSKLPEGIIVDINEAFEQVFGYTKQEAVGSTSLELGINPGVEERARVLAALKEHGSAHNQEMALHTKSGELRIMSVNVDLVDIGSQKYILNLAQDITERKRAEEEILILNADLERRVAERTVELQQANRELEAFSYSISHDLRAPLRAMDGFSRILVEEYADGLPSEAAHYLERVRKNAQQMAELIDALLAFSRLSRQPLKMRIVPPTDLAQQALEDLRAAGEAGEAQVTIGDLPTCQADPALLRQVYANLLGNALKFTRGQEDAQVEVGCKRIDDKVVYYVKDNGAGFDMQYADKLFGVFQRLHRAEEYEGTGVGLATVQRIIHRHGGRIWAEAAVGEGATFYFTLGEDSDERTTGGDTAG